jgi:NADPH:quinone reductase
MKAIRIHQNGDASVLKLEDIPIPKPGPKEALIRLKTAGLNFVDIYIREGRYPFPLPLTPGTEGAGIVEAVGEGVTEVKPGDRVAYAMLQGSFAEYNIVKAAQLIPLPQEMNFEQAAAFPLQGMTAHYLLHEFYSIKPGTTVLVHAAAGGMGLLLVQWLKHMGAHVIGTVSTVEKAKIVKEAGADHVILYTKEDFATETLRITNGKGADYIIDGVGKSTFAKNLDAVRVRGAITIFGSASGPADPISPNALMPKAITLNGGSLQNFIKTRDELLLRANAALKGIQEGWLKLRIAHVFPLAQAADAQKFLEERKSIGKVILKISD